MEAIQLLYNIIKEIIHKLILTAPSSINFEFIISKQN